ncbi:TetR family transcriptional regulator [Parafrankia sp. FMc6]|uniref:TetR family transcriptional regulator n=1 Tax=Parafrankia soli TaxID=2599596 RepID=UPI0034D75ED0
MEVESRLEVGGRKSEMTRQRLLLAAHHRFRAHGYAATTAAAIAEDAGVTERTFFRYFPAKADVLVNDWQVRRRLLKGVLATSDAPELLDVARVAMHEFTDDVRTSIETGRDSILRVFNERDASSAVLEVLLEAEHDLAMELSRRAGRSSEDFQVRMAAYATVGVFRAALRAVVSLGMASYLTALVDDGMERLRPLYAGLDQASPRPV